MRSEHNNSLLPSLIKMQISSILEKNKKYRNV